MSKAKRGRSSSDSESESGDSDAGVSRARVECEAQAQAMLAEADPTAAYLQTVRDAIAQGVGEQLARIPYRQKYKSYSFEVRVVADWAGPRDGAGAATHLVQEEHQHVLEVRVAHRQLVRVLMPVAYTFMRDAVERGVTEIANFKLGKTDVTAVWMGHVTARRSGIVTSYRVTHFPPPPPREGEVAGDGRVQMAEFIGLMRAVPQFVDHRAVPD